MPALAFVTPLAGASLQQVWKPPVGVTPGAAGDATAPFALGTVGFVTPGAANNRVLAQFVRCAGVIAIGGTATIALGVATAGAGTWTNETGVALALGDYVFLSAGVTPALAADDTSVEPPGAAKAGYETPEERKLREAEEAEYQKAEKERASKKAHS
jgi:hypothetical protein